jgi:pyruvate/2-oxoglutarate dehydrogenase complex dihydrolipoamide acyltransferase (E2) component
MSDKKEIVSASPKVRKLVREFGADIYQIQGSQREGSRYYRNGKI